MLHRLTHVIVAIYLIDFSKFCTETVGEIVLQIILSVMMMQ